MEPRNRFQLIDSASDNKIGVPARQAESRFLGSLKGLQIRAQYSSYRTRALDWSAQIDEILWSGQRVVHILKDFHFDFMSSEPKLRHECSKYTTQCYHQEKGDIEWENLNRKLSIQLMIRIFSLITKNMDEARLQSQSTCRQFKEEIAAKRKDDFSLGSLRGKYKEPSFPPSPPSI